jgi:spore coat protein H
MKDKYLIILIVMVIIPILFFSCEVREGTDPDEEKKQEAIDYNPDWTENSHGNVKPDYAVTFPQDAVNKIEITMTLLQWKEIRTNMTSLYGADFGGKQITGGAFTSVDPDYKDVLFKFNGKQWKNVGFRLKGNSSLRTIWSQGNYKLPFRLNFDKFEDKYPRIKNQHFYGFEELSFSPGFKDQTLMHEKLAADIFRMGGIPAPKTAFYRVYIDFGSGMQYFGVYTCVEIPDDNMIKEQFGEENGNIYKPESNLTNFIMSQFEKKNNDSIPDYSDVKSLVAILNSNLRTTDHATWKKNLEGVFNVNHFMKWLAINNAIVNWDTYGAMAHNYYLYNHTINKLTWIPWDNNEAFAGSPGITKTTSQGTGQPPVGPQTGLSLTMNEVTNTWPLIRYLVDDPEYFQLYKNYLKEFTRSVFTVANINPIIDSYNNLISQYAIGTDGEKVNYTHLINSASFTSATPALKLHVKTRADLITGFVN